MKIIEKASHLEKLDKNYYHCAIFNYSSSDTVDIFISNNDYYKDDIEKISAIEPDKAFSKDTNEFKILSEAIEKFGHTKIKKYKEVERNDKTYN